MWRRGMKSRSSVEGRSSTVERERHQTVEQSQSGGVSGLNRVCAGVKGEGGECVCEGGGGEGGRGDEKRKGVEISGCTKRKSVTRTTLGMFPWQLEVDHSPDTNTVCRKEGV